MSARPFYETVYHRTDWRLADAFRPQPGWGSRVFTAPVSALEGVAEDALIGMAMEAAPEGHRLTKLSIYEDGLPERVIWSTSPDARFAPPSIGCSTSRGEGA
jgi:hypothetical protein